MKIFFTTTPRAKSEFKQNIQKIYQIIRDLGHKLTDDTLEKVSEKEFYSWNSKQRQEYFQKIMRAIKTCDVAVFEVSFPSLSSGFLIGQAVRANKPCVVLYLENKEPIILDGVRNEKIIFIPYNGNNLQRELKSALAYAKEQNDVRFNFFISSKILQYLNWIASHRQIPRSVYLRNLIEADMAKNEEYNRDN